MLGRSWRLWQASDLPYESALARLHYAEAIAAEGDEATARMDPARSGPRSSGSAPSGTCAGWMPCLVPSRRRPLERHDA